MKIRILGCSGARSIDGDPTCFLIDDSILIDSGSVTGNLTDDSIKKIDHLIITHAHFDHIADLPFLMEKLFWIEKNSFTIHSSRDSHDTIISHILNNSIWPNLVEIAKSKNELFKWEEFSSSKPFKISDYEVTPIRVNHIVPTDGFIIDDGKSSFAFSADTYKTDDFWNKCKEQKNLKAIISGVSFPSHMDETAEITKHLTPKLFYEEVKRLGRDDVKFYISHLKPLFKNEVLEDIKKLPMQNNLEILHDGIEIVID
ncbi:MAG: 3',5'-cyclic-nucleotide phosphodiesterase [Candidatus Dadabacteria bacterium]|nr:3',5'-cyclic-nucleotide phosphodiesterase [Candidatus Dadabacteria bacterium]NIS09110.1 3',5'-cyclic-nucleotide phosphodiesterase [Candidatus Dadabacteria bacterium]NIV41543.1 MBL fold metallo-hydrolase [Candidatus Dadabacteria bacterium]NIX15687.1 MBL fold metallo-hydrolase [Candidatus Dadabacteria bacterium]NIY22418.1 MBL fold metallo-hydrolase [Candidatus Dadabacteria bacterium]